VDEKKGDSGCCEGDKDIERNVDGDGSGSFDEIDGCRIIEGERLTVRDFSFSS